MIPEQLSRRERQIMDVLYRLGQASVKEVQDTMEDAPGYSSVRTLLGKLVEKGHVAHREDGARYVYFPLVEPDVASQSALSRVVKVFFGDSPYLAVNSLLDMSIDKLTDEELEQLDELIRRRKQQSADKGEQ